MPQLKEKLELATCIACGHKYWATEEHCANVRARRCKSLCRDCEVDKEPSDEDDNSVSFREEFGDRDPQENTQEVR